MGFFKNYRQRRVSLTGPESIATLSAMERFFQGGKNWTQGEYHAADGRKCLVGAAQSMRAAALGDAQYWLLKAINERQPGTSSIEGFNDSRMSFTEIAEIVARAKQLAAAAAAQILPPPRRPALTHQPESARPTITLAMADLERVAVKRS